MTDEQFERIKKGLNFHSEGGIDNLCTMTETTLRAVLDDATKELKEQIEKMKNCKNCANYMISGKCPSFFRTGWCKNWEMSKGVSND